MGGTSPFDEPVDPKQKADFQYGYPHEHYNNFPNNQPTLGYPIPQYYQPDGNNNNNNNNYPPVPGQQYPAYYNYNLHQPSLIIEPESTGYSFYRLMLIFMVFIVGSIFMMVLVTWLLFGTYIPEFEILSLRVSNFSTADHVLTGTWDASLAITNTNQDLTISFRNLRSVVLYNGNILGFSVTPGFDIGGNRRVDLNVSVPAGENKMNVDDSLLPALEQDWNNGVAVFSLRLAMTANFSSKESAYREESLSVSCDEMMVDSSAGASEGRASKGVGGRMCLINL